jgi:hypothetical protein
LSSIGGLETGVEVSLGDFNMTNEDSKLSFALNTADNSTMSKASVLEI